jgi:pSer/pThr/pTyr-binding forkhead associated (FHA) protein
VVKVNYVVLGISLWLGLTGISALVFLMVRRLRPQPGHQPNPPKSHTTAIGGLPPEAYLIVDEGPSHGKTFDIQKSITTLGRAEHNDCVIGDPYISGEQAWIKWTRSKDGARFLLNDFGSTNGTYLNGERIRAEQKLNDGALIEFGQTKIRFEKKPAMKQPSNIKQSENPQSAIG